MKDINKVNLKNKTILLRVDLNSDVINKKILMSERIKQSANTIKLLKNKKAKLVVIAHQGRPGKKDFTSLKQHAKLINKLTKIKFVPDIIGKKAESSIKNLKPGQALLLENIRKLKQEFEPYKKNDFVKKLSKWCDIYVNDAFSVCHRKHSSIISFPKYMKSFAGPFLKKEIQALKKIHLKKSLFILGGAKPEDNIKLLKKNKVLACGLFGQMCVIAKNKNLGAQNKYLKKNIKNYNSLINNLKKKLNKNIITPVDFAVKVKGKRKELGLNDFPSKYEIYDIGKQTQKLYIEKIRKANSIYMKGPAGYCEDKKFCKGTIKLLKAISNNKAFSLIGGGHLSNALKKFHISKKFNYVSLSGGALVNYLAGEKLPGLEALK